jgi:hypothetical protein
MTRASATGIARRRRGRPKGSTVPIEEDPDRYKLAAWRAFYADGFSSFNASRLALLATDPDGGPITIEDVDGLLAKASATIPLPQPFDPDDTYKGERRLAAKAKRANPEPWLINSAGLLHGLITFIRDKNMTGICVTLDGLDQLGWRPVLMGLAKRVEAALGSNLPPADLDKLSPAVRRLLAELRQKPKK